MSTALEHPGGILLHLSSLRWGCLYQGSLHSAWQESSVEVVGCHRKEERWLNQNIPSHPEGTSHGELRCGVPNSCQRFQILPLGPGPCVVLPVVVNTGHEAEPLSNHYPPPSPVCQSSLQHIMKLRPTENLSLYLLWFDLLQTKR